MERYSYASPPTQQLLYSTSGYGAAETSGAHHSSSSGTSGIFMLPSKDYYRIWGGWRVGELRRPNYPKRAREATFLHPSGRLWRRNGRPRTNARENGLLLHYCTAAHTLSVPSQNN